MPAITNSGSPCSFTKLGNSIGIGIRKVKTPNLSYDRIMRGKYLSAVVHGLLHSGTRIVPYSGICLVSHSRTYLCALYGKPKIDVTEVPSDSFGGDGFEKSMVDGINYSGVKNQWVDYLNLGVGGISGLVAAMPIIFSKLLHYGNPGILLPWNSLLESLIDEKCFFTSLEPPFRYLTAFVIMQYLVIMVAPSHIVEKYLAMSGIKAFIISLVWFLHRWKANVINHTLKKETLEGVDRNKLWTVDKVLSIGLFVIGLMLLKFLMVEYGFGVKSILILVQSIFIVGGAATVFAGNDVLGNILSGLYIRISEPFSIGENINVGSVEGTVEKMGLTTTTLLSTKKFPIRVPNSLFSSQVTVNKSSVQCWAMVTKIRLEIGNFDKILKISEDIVNMFKSNKNVYLGEETPYCFLSGIERSYVELTLRCNLKATSNNQQFSAQQENILLQCVHIVNQYGGTLVGFAEDT